VRVLAAVAALGLWTLADIIPVAGSGHGREPTAPSVARNLTIGANLETFRGQFISTDDTREICFAGPILIENIGISKFYFQSRNAFGCFRGDVLLDCHVRNNRSVRGRFASSGNPNPWRVVKPIPVEYNLAIDAIPGVLERHVPDEIPCWRLACIRGDEAYARADSVEHKIKYHVLDMDIGPDLGFADTPRFNNLLLASIPNCIRCPPQEDGCHKQQSRKQGDEKPLIFVDVTNGGRRYASNPAGDWMALVIIGWFMIPVAAIYWWIEWLFMGWLFATAVLAMLGLK
jgi:hypothetical protein